MTWSDGESRTIEYTPGQYMLTVLNTDAPFDSSSGSVVSGAAPTGVEVYFNCINSDSRCAYFSGTPTGSGVTTITLRMDAGDGRTADIAVTFQPAFSLTGALTATGIVGGLQLVAFD
ncbi:MAG: hypothetical protein R2724_04085 [Bryobacterales bacterium]